MSDFISDSLAKKLAEDFGTPLYLYKEEIFKAKYEALAKALSGLDFRIHYAVKANSNLSVLWVFKQLGAGFDVVSLGEFGRAEAAGASGAEIVFAGVGKTDEEIEHAVRAGAHLINVESPEELAVIEAIAKKLKKSARIGLRVNPNIKVDTHEHLETGVHSSKFGMTFDEAEALWPKIRSSSSLILAGLHCHIGSNISDIQPLAEAYQAVRDLALKLKENGAPIDVLDLGGGLGISYSGRYEALSMEDFGAATRKIFKDAPFKLIFEPGKFLAAEAGALLTRVLYTKSTGVKDFVVVDAGMNDLIRPALYDAFHKIELLGARSGKSGKKVDIVGPICESGCFFAKDRELPLAGRGDLLLVRDSGAYGMSMASRYNSRPLAAEVMVRADGSRELIRKREELEDLWREEVG